MIKLLKKKNRLTFLRRLTLIPVIFLLIQSCSDGLEKQESYYPNGNIKDHYIEKEIVAGDTIGVYESFYEDGTLKEQKHYKNKKLHGKFYEYYENGNLKSEFDMMGDTLNGFAIFYSDNGTMEEKTLYSNKTMLTSTVFRKNGTKEILSYCSSPLNSRT